MEIMKFNLQKIYKNKKVINFLLLIFFINFSFSQEIIAKLSDKYAVRTYYKEAPIMPGAAEYFVRSEKIERKTKLLNNHPIKIPSNVLKRMFAQLSYKYDREENAIPLFSNKELNLLSDNVSKALSVARPNEDITFVIKGPHSSTRWSFREDRLNAGRIFVANNQLNIILGAVQVGLQPTLPERYQGNVWETQSISYDIGYRKKKAKFDGLIIVYDEKKKGIFRKSAKRKDWFIFTNVAYKRALGVDNSNKQQKGMSDAEYKDLQRQIDSLQKRIGNEKSTPAPVPKRNVKRTPKNQSNQNLNSNKSSKKNNSIILEQRLKTIENLFKKGILSEEEYQRKRQEILSGI